VQEGTTYTGKSTMPSSRKQGEWLGLLSKRKVIVLVRAAAKISCWKLLTFSKESVRLLGTSFERLLIFRFLIRCWDSTKAPPHVHQHQRLVLFAPCPPPFMLDLNLNPSVRSHLFLRAGPWPHRTPISRRGPGRQATHFSIPPHSHARTRRLLDPVLSPYLPLFRTQ
jgi:hypothetical protein